MNTNASYILNNLKLTPARQWTYDAASLDLLNKYVWTEINPHHTSADPMAYATRSKGLTGVFEIYVNPNAPAAAKKFLKIHERGHIIFSHMSLQEAQRNMILEKIATFWPSISKKLVIDPLMSKSEINHYIKRISNMFLNMAMDFEVNSKLFTEEEWKEVRVLTDEATFVTNALAPKTSDKTLEKIAAWVKEINAGNKVGKFFSKPCWPGDYGMPLQLSYNEYLDLMLADCEKFMTNIKNVYDPNYTPADYDNIDDEDLRQNLNDKIENPEDIENPEEGDGNSDSESDAGDNESQNGESADGDADDNEGQSDSDSDNKSNNSSDSDSEGDGKMTLDQIEEIYNSMSDTDNSENQAKTEAAELENNKANGQYSAADNGSSGTGVADYSRVIADGKASKNIVTYLKKQLAVKTNTSRRIDNMYNFNRRKFGTTIVSKVRTNTKVELGNVYFIVDCSGSVSHQMCRTFAESAKEIAKDFGKKSRIIWWDTKNEGDYLLTKFEMPKSSGSTNIARGIDYVNDTYKLGKEDKLVIISDYYDSLYAWNESLSKVKCDAVGVCWIERNDDSAIKGEKAKSLLKKLPTKVFEIAC